MDNQFVISCKYLNICKWTL